MDNQETLQTTVEDVIDLEEIESFSSNSAEVSPDNCSRKQRSVTTKHYGHRKKLNCRHGYNIFIYPNGTVKASNDDSDKHCVMEFTSMLPGHVRIKGVEANLFLAMDRNGLLYGEPDPTKNSTIFIEQPEGPYSAYLSLKYRHKKWYLAIKKNGKIKSGPETKRGQHATHFLSLPV